MKAFEDTAFDVVLLVEEVLSACGLSFMVFQLVFDEGLVVFEDFLVILYVVLDIFEAY